MSAAQLQNLRALLDTGERILANPIACQLGFSQVDCGSYACFIGWHVRWHGNQEGILVYLEPFINGRKGYWCYDSERVAEHFGINFDEIDELFQTATTLNYMGVAEGISTKADEPSPEAYIELRRRLGVLRDIIVRKEAGIGVEPSAQSAAA